MRTKIPLLAGVGVVAVGAVVFAVLAAGGDGSVGESATAQATATEVASDEPRRQSWPHDADAERLVAELAEAGTPKARRDLNELYAKWGADPTKVWARQAIIDALLAGETPQKAIATLLAAVDGDRKLPGADDPTFDHGAKQLMAFWEIPEMFEYGRDRLVAARTDKSRAMLAKSLCDFVAGEGEAFVDPQHQRKAWLAADLVDAHGATGDAWAQERIRDGVRNTMGEDMAKVLVDPLSVGPAELERIQARLEGIRSGSKAVARGDVTADGNEAAIERLRNLDDEELSDAVGQGVANPHRPNPHQPAD